MAICWEKSVPLAFHLCCFYFSAVLIVGVYFLFVFRAGCGIQLYRFLIITFFICLTQKLNELDNSNCSNTKETNNITNIF